MLFIKENLLSLLSRYVSWDKRQQEVTHTNTVIFLGFTLWYYHRAWVIWRIKRIELFITLHILNITDTIEDFLQMIFKIIIQTLQTSNTSASQSEITSEIISENIQNLRASVKVRGGWDFPKTKTPDTDVILVLIFIYVVLLFLKLFSSWHPWIHPPIVSWQQSLYELV